MVRHSMYGGMQSAYSSNMDKQYSVQFFTSFVEAMQKFCREYIDFEQCVELSGYLAVEIDNHKKERYVLSEMLQSSGNVISESYCTKAFKTLRKEPSVSVSQVDTENFYPNHHRTSISNRKYGLPSPGLNVSHSNRDRHHAYEGSQTSMLNRRRQNFLHTNQRVRKGAVLNSRLSHPSETVVNLPSADQIGVRPLDQIDSNSPDCSIITGQKRSATNTSYTDARSANVKRDKRDPVLEDLMNASSNSTSDAEANLESTTNTLTMAAPAAVSPPDPSNTGFTALRENMEVKKESDPDIPYMVIDDPLEAECDNANLFDSADTSNSGTVQLDTTAMFGTDLQTFSSSDGGTTSMQVGLASTTRTKHHNESSMGIAEDCWSNQMNDRRMILTQQEEQQFCCLLRSSAANGVSLTRALVLQMASEFAVNSGKRGHKQGVSRQWYYKFLDRWPEMRLVISSRMDAKQNIGLGPKSHDLGWN